MLMWRCAVRLRAALHGVLSSSAYCTVLYCIVLCCSGSALWRAATCQVRETFNEYCKTRTNALSELGQSLHRLMLTKQATNFRGIDSLILKDFSEEAMQVYASEVYCTPPCFVARFRAYCMGSLGLSAKSLLLEHVVL